MAEKASVKKENESSSVSGRAGKESMNRHSASQQAPALVQRAQQAPGSLSHSDLVTLQQTVGMRGIQRLLANTPTGPQRAVHLPTSLQRTLNQRGVAVQTKLTVGAADDQYEREADRVAAQVMSSTGDQGSGSAVSRKEDEETAQRRSAITPLVQREESETTDLAGSFDAGHDVERQLSAGSSGGNPLPAKLRSDLEPKFGADFSNVRVHTGAQSDLLNRSLGAQAFTHSNHIYMGAGKYNPGSASGKHLLAHELTHVVQQTGSVARTKLNDTGVISRQAMAGIHRASAKIQRAVGFEFETGYKILKKQGANWVNLPKATVVKSYGNGVNLTADENSAGFSAIEMVLDPPVQETDPKKFKSAVTTFKKVGNAFDSFRKDAPKPRLLNKVPSPASGSSNYQITPAFSGFEGNAQLTGGIRYDQLYKFLEHANTSVNDVTDTHKNAKNELTRFKGNDTVSISGANTQVNAIHGSNQLKGLVAMLGMYLNTGKAGLPMLNYAKLISSSFMARTDFGAMYNHLPDSDRDRFVKDPVSFVDLVLNAAGLPGTDATRVFDRGIRKSDVKTSVDYNTNVVNEVAEIAISRRQWLLGITMGGDPISSAGMPHLQHILMGLGALGSRTDRVGNDPKPLKGAKNKGEGVILELRNMKLAKTPDQFATAVTDIFNYIVALNAE